MHFRPALHAFGLVFVGACGSAGTYRNGHYSDSEASYFVAGPGAGWDQIAVDRGGDIAWMDDTSSAVIQVNASCDPAMDIPLAALTNHLLIGFTEREILEQATVPFSGREAMRTTVTAKLDGVDRRLVLVVLKKDGCVYDFLLAMSAAPRASAESTFESVLSSFRTSRDAT